MVQIHQFTFKNKKNQPNGKYASFYIHEPS